ncbi:uncharacterized protein LOC108103200 [Drosophila eugracilis]|uniref:uncharacterized protein LOC108103200 n=1 Tax=Drosophila eugracilis TaxID=29029 RepID=UPI0007E612B4|nr:uncharacterized protein LOC108103200 [Drosophila eugracilis]
MSVSSRKLLKPMKMSGIWILLLLGLVITQGRSQTATPIESDPLGQVNEAATKKLQSYLDNFQGNWRNNSEFLNWIGKIRTAVEDNSTKLEEKFRLIINFETFNAERLIWEKHILLRIEELNGIISHLTNLKCVTFYVDQKYGLQRALNLSNLKKRETFTENSMPCLYIRSEMDEHIKYIVNDLE